MFLRVICLKVYDNTLLVKLMFLWSLTCQLFKIKFVFYLRFFTAILNGREITLRWQNAQFYTIVRCRFYIRGFGIAVKLLKSFIFTNIIASWILKFIVIWTLIEFKKILDQFRLRIHRCVKFIFICANYFSWWLKIWAF